TQPPRGDPGHARALRRRDRPGVPARGGLARGAEGRGARAVRRASPRAQTLDGAPRRERHSDRCCLARQGRGQSGDPSPLRAAAGCGGMAQFLVPKQAYPTDIAVDATGVFWINADDHAIKTWTLEFWQVDGGSAVGNHTAMVGSSLAPDAATPLPGAAA